MDCIAPPRAHTSPGGCHEEKADSEPCHVRHGSIKGHNLEFVSLHPPCLPHEMTAPVTQVDSVLNQAPLLDSTPAKIKTAFGRSGMV